MAKNDEICPHLLSLYSTSARIRLTSIGNSFNIWTFVFNLLASFCDNYWMWSVWLSSLFLDLLFPTATKIKMIIAAPISIRSNWQWRKRATKYRTLAELTALWLSLCWGGVSRRLPNLTKMKQGGKILNQISLRDFAIEVMYHHDGLLRSFLESQNDAVSGGVFAYEKQRPLYRLRNLINRPRRKIVVLYSNGSALQTLAANVKDAHIRRPSFRSTYVTVNLIISRVNFLIKDGVVPKVWSGIRSWKRIICPYLSKIDISKIFDLTLNGTSVTIPVEGHECFYVFL